jgi:hypothetical protein
MLRPARSGGSSPHQLYQFLTVSTKPIEQGGRPPSSGEQPVYTRRTDR